MCVIIVIILGLVAPSLDALFVSTRAEDNVVQKDQASIMTTRQEKLGSTASDIVSNSGVLQNVYTYPPELFEMYNNCEQLVKDLPELTPFSRWDYKVERHNVDTLLVRSMTALEPYNITLTTSPDHATLFIVPVYWSQSISGKCGDHQQNVAQMLTVLQDKFPWYARNSGQDHAFVCDAFARCEEARQVFKGVILGAFEKDYYPPATKEFEYLHGRPLIGGAVIPVGYNTYAAPNECEKKDNLSYGEEPVGGRKPFPLADRLYDISFAGQTKKDIHLHSYGTDPYERRRALWCDWVDTQDKRPGFLIQAFEASCESQMEDQFLQKERIHTCRALSNIQESRMMISFSGDTPTTDRIFNAFDTLTIVVVLSDEKQAIIDTLPARDRVPWNDILIEIDTDEFLKGPVKSVEQLVDRMSQAKLKAVQDLMSKYRRDVLWHIEDSQAAAHFIAAAKATLQGNEDAPMNPSLYKRWAANQV
jgi:hypothetical protein